MMRMSVILVLALATFVHGRSKDIPLSNSDFGPDSPWILNRASKHVQGQDNHARFSGVSFTTSRGVTGDETEYRVYHNGVVAMETVMKRLGESALFFREVTDGKKLIKLLYAGRRGLVECDVQRNMLDVDIFLSEFSGSENSYIGHLRRIGRDIDVIVITGKSEIAQESILKVTEENIISEPYATLLNVEELHQECIRLHHRIKHRMVDNGIDVDSYRKVMTTEDREVSKEFIPRRVKRTKRGAQKTRSKRSILVPDTKWCGAGSDNENFEDVGHNRGTDRCCREHDHCPYFIESFSSDYNLYNARFYTISHCYCDEVFRTCLKTSNSDESTMVGRIYFNFLGMKCFEFEMESVCLRRSWWGSCQESEDQIVAKIRGSLSWD